MKKPIKYLLVAIILAASLSSCTKIWEEEQIEIRPRPQIEVQPEVPDWDLQSTNDK